MVKERDRVTIEIDTKSYLAQALRDGAMHSIILVSDGNEYEVVRIGGARQNDESADRARDALQPAPGIFSPEEAEGLKQRIYKWREAGTRPLGRP